MNYRGHLLSANVSMLFTELPYPDRFAAAAQAGFQVVESWWPFPTAAPDAARHLAPFLRFAGTTQLEGSNLIDSGGQAIQRSYTSTLLPDRVTVRFRYQAASAPAGDWEDFETEATWLRIDADTILATLHDSNLNLTGLLGGYDCAPYSSRSARCICNAAAQ